MVKLIWFILLASRIYANTIIELKKDNFISLREPISQESSARLLSKLNNIESKHETLYLYINSPGGDVLAGLEIINYIKSLQQRNKKVICIAHNAISMAFVIFQYCSHRYILYSSTLMQHQMYLGIKGKLQEINSRMSYLNILETKLNQEQALRLNMSLPDFTQIIQNDWWLYGDSIIYNKAADEIISFFCSFENYEETVSINTLFGDVTIKYSACPLINYPIDIKFPSLNLGEERKKEFMDSHIHFTKKLVF
jgi:ATP-dependent Clp protease protease subunit